jgi:NAD(P)H-nitrite reductase large subunit
VKPDDKLCYCFHVSQRKVVNFIRIHRPQVASQLSECGGAGTGCGWCVPFLKKCFAAANSEEAEVSGLSAEEYAQQRADYIAAGKKRSPDADQQ